MKLLRVEDIAREALCTTLARLLNLPVLQAYYVHIDPSYIDSRTAGNPDNIAFGLEKDPSPTFPVRNIPLEDLARKWPEALSCAVFDQWICNGDRLPDNLIFGGIDTYWLIDHDEALPNYASPDTPVNSPLLRMLSDSKSEIELWKLLKEAMRRVQRYEDIDWDNVLKLLRPRDLPGSERFYIGYIEFLRNRIPAMHDIITTSIGIRQTQLDLADNKVPINKIGKKT